MEDWQLIREYVGLGSETAFRTLVSRHLNHVHATALRMVGDAQLAEEVTQAVFILLARKAPKLPRTAVLGGWLYHTARFVAARALRSERRRKRREEEAFRMQQGSGSDDGWQKLSPLLDEGLGQLAQQERNALVLRYFQEKPLREVGQTLGLSEDAARKRVTRALEKLRLFFGRKGLTLSAAALTTVLAGHTAEAAPQALSETMASAALSHAGGAVQTLPLLARETVQAWRRTQLAARFSLAGAAILTALLLSTAIRSGRSHTSQPQGTAVAELAPAVPPSVQAQPSDAPQPGAASGLSRGRFTFRALDAENGRPLGGARVLAVAATDPANVNLQTNLVTDPRGWCEVPLVYSNPLMLAVGVLADGYEERCVALGGKESIPDNYVLNLKRGTRIGGVVQDEAGNPVAGANIYVQFYGTGDAEWRESQRERPGFPADDIVVARTDAAGRWRFGSASSSDGGYALEVGHPDFPRASFTTDADEHGRGIVSRLAAADLHAGTAVLVVHAGLNLRGAVTEESGRPIAGVKVTLGQFASGNNSATETGTEGSFVLRSLPAGANYVTFVADHFAPERIEVEVAANSSPLAVRLKAAGHLMVRVVDESGNPLSGVMVRLQAWRGHNTLDWGGTTDADGRIEWHSAPQDELDLAVLKEGYFYSRNNLLKADWTEHVITLHPQLTVFGTVTDAETGQPLEHFKVVPGTEPEQWQRINVVNGTNGQYRLSFTERRAPFLARFEAEGYESAVAEVPGQAGPEQTLNTALKRLTLSTTIRGVVLLPDGTPAAGVQVALCTGTKGVTLGWGRFLDNRPTALLVKADAAGRFQFALEPDAQALVSACEQGFTHQQLTFTNPTVALQLQPWGRIQGRLILRHPKAAASQITLMQLSGPHTAGRAVALDLQAFSTTTDEHGDFAFEEVPPGDFNLYLNRGVGIPFSHQTPVSVRAGATAQSQIGGAGRDVVGRLTLANTAQKVNWPRQATFASISTKWEPPPMPTGLSAAEGRVWLAHYSDSEEGQARMKSSRSYPLQIESDGAFTVEDVPQGTYEINVHLMDTPSDLSRPRPTGKPLGFVRREVTVPASADPTAETPLDVGTIRVEDASGRH
jgi:RNA polymerase sigma factor (sigma-70 family)